MPPKATAVSGGSGVGPSRRTWDVEEYTAKAREQSREDRARHEENEERARKGKPPLRRPREILPKPTAALQARESPLELDKNVGKTLMVDADRRGGPGYYCELCRRTCKDSIGYLDHINGRSHLRRLGQTTQVARSTPEQVRAHIQELLEKVRSTSAAHQEYDFQERVAAIARQEADRRRERKEKKIQAKRDKEKLSSGNTADDAAMMQMMGFGGFGSSKK